MQPYSQLPELLSIIPGKAETRDGHVCGATCLTVRLAPEESFTPTDLIFRQPEAERMFLALFQMLTDENCDLYSSEIAARFRLCHAQQEYYSKD